MANQLVKVGNVVTPAVIRVLTPAQYGDLAEIPPELEWFANLTNPKTRDAYRIDVQEFSTFAGLRGHAEFRTVTRVHVIAWRKRLEVLPTSNGAVLKIRQATIPEPLHREIYSTLGISNQMIKPIRTWHDA